MRDVLFKAARVALHLSVAGLAVACGKIGGSSSFTLPSSGVGSSLTSSFLLNGWSGPQGIDVGTEPLSVFAEANNDISSSCTDMFQESLNAVQPPVRGCMQTPAMAYTDNRFMVGFTQNYVGTSGGAPRVTLFDSMTNPLNHTFLGGLSVIDTGRGLFPWSNQIPLPGPGDSPMSTSSRYVRYATFPNGNMVAVYYVEVPVNTGCAGGSACGVGATGGDAPFGSSLQISPPTNIFTVTDPQNYSYARIVYASIYSATNHQWGPPTQLGTATLPALGSNPNVFTNVNQTDFGVDFGENPSEGPLAGTPPFGIAPYITGSYTNFCRPSVATAGDGTAMVAWCEQPQTPDATGTNMLGAPEPLAQIRYARYVNGAWQASKWLIDSPPNSFPIVVGATGSPPLLANPYWAGRDNHVGLTTGMNIQAGNVFASGFAFGAAPPFNSTFSVVLGAQVTAVTANPTSSQFIISIDASQNVRGCETLAAMISALLAQPVAEYWLEPGSIFAKATSVSPNNPPGYFFGTATHPPLPSLTLSQLGISMKVNPSCLDTDTTTWNVSTYYNRSLNNIFGNAYAPAIYAAGSSPAYTQTALNPALATNSSEFAPNGLFVPVDLHFAASSGNAFQATAANPAVPSSLLPWPNPQYDWIRSAVVDVAGDGQGNYALVRSSVMPFFQETDVSLNGVGNARALVGHEFSQGKWIQRASKPVDSNSNEPALSLVSQGVICEAPGASGNALVSGQYAPCSVRSPKVLVSQSGQGLILFYQNQFNQPSAVATSSPNRLWWASYSSATGFGSAAQILDIDTTCSSTSTGNDASVCEAASFFDTIIASGLPSLHCQTVGEPSSRTSEPLFTSITHDITPIAAAMNASGQAVVAYAKSQQLPTSPPTCGPIGIFAMTYDPSNGWSGVTQVDNGLTVSDPITGVDVGTADSMHPSVFITPGGSMAVAWESVVMPNGASGASGASSASGSSSTVPLTSGVGQCLAAGASGASGTTGGPAVGVYFSLMGPSGGGWSSPTLVNSSATGPSVATCLNHMMPNDSMMPAVALNDSGEIVVTYTYSPYGPSGELFPRRQFANHYYIPPGQ